MLVAILSDTHDNLANLTAALTLLRPRNPALYIHCGDLCEPEVLDAFAGLPMRFVFGNNDFDHAGLKARAGELGLGCDGDLAKLALAGKQVAVIHGDDFSTRRALRDGQQFDYLLSGHTHRAADHREGRTRLINPGALHRAKEKTVALLDLATDTLEFLKIG